MRVQKRLQSALPYVVVLAAGAFLSYSADHFEFTRTPGRIGPDAWPKLVLGVMMVIALWGVVSSFLGAGQPAQPLEADVDDAEALVHPPEIYPHLVWIGIAATLGYLIVLPIVGFFIATVFYVGVIIYLGHYRNLPYVFVISLGLPLLLMILFMRIVYVALPLGVAPFDAVSLAIISMIGVH